MATATKTRPAAAPVDAASHTATYAEIPVEHIQPSRLNPRKHFDDADLRALADSILAHGLLEPVVVRYVATRITVETDRYELICGERRWRAARIANLPTIPARILGAVEDRVALQLAIVENLQRKDLDPIEQAEGFKALAEQAGMTQAAIAQAVKVSQPTIAKAVGLLKLPPDVQQLIREGTLSQGHGHILEKWAPFPKYLAALVKVITEEGWTTKRLAKEKLYVGYSMAGSVVKQIGYGTLFDQTICAQCPFDARRTDKYQRAYCMRPAHYEELQEQAKAAQAARVEAAKTQAISDGGKAILHLQDLPYSTYEDLAYAKPPAGCTKDCPCRSVGLTRDGKQHQICTDPARHRALKTEAAQAEKKAKRARVKEQLAALGDHLQALETIDARELALVCSQALAYRSGVPAVRAAAQRHNLADLLPDKQMPNADDLAKLAPLDILRLTVDALLTHDLHRPLEADYYHAELYPWYEQQLQRKGKADGQ